MDKKDAIDLLQEEDEALRGLFGRLEASSGPGIAERYTHGDQCKQLIRRMAVREAAKADIVHILDGVDDLGAVRSRLIGEVKARRRAINLLDKMSRHIRPIEVNRSDDFDGGIVRLREIVDPEIAWELEEGIDALRERVPAHQRARLHHDRYLRTHAPTKLNPNGFRRYERVRVVSWFLTLWDHLEDRPRPLPQDQAD